MEVRRDKTINRQKYCTITKRRHRQTTAGFRTPGKGQHMRPRPERDEHTDHRSMKPPVRVPTKRKENPPMGEPAGSRHKHDALRPGALRPNTSRSCLLQTRRVRFLCRKTKKILVVRIALPPPRTAYAKKSSRVRKTGYADPNPNPNPSFSDSIRYKTCVELLYCCNPRLTWTWASAPPAPV